MNRLDRLTSILIQLQSKKVIRAQEIADRFGISLRTVYRDMRSLEEAGVPISAEAGSGYSLVDGYRLPPVQFTRDEALTMLTAEKLVQSLTDKQTSQTHQSALLKIKAVLNSSEKELLQKAENHILVLDNKYLPTSRLENIPLQELLEGIAQHRVLHIRYHAGMLQKTSERFVETVGVFAAGSYWYIMAYCRLRKDYRQFRVDRIVSYAFLDERFSTKHPPLHDLVKNEEPAPSFHVIIRVDKAFYAHLGDQPYYHGLQKTIDKGDQMEMHFTTSSLTGLSYWFMVFGSGADIVSPQELKDLVAVKIQELVDRQAQEKPQPETANIKTSSKKNTAVHSY